MNLAELIYYLLCSMGLTVLLVWPEQGPSAWLRETILHKVLGDRASRILDCYVCTSFWASLLVAAAWQYFFDDASWTWLGCVAVPALFWMLLPSPSEESNQHAGTNSSDA